MADVGLRTPQPSSLIEALLTTGQEVYDILVRHAGAPDGESSRVQFDSFWRKRHDLREYRFIGSLGFGGKLWVSQDPGIGYYVNCYQEDLTAEREAVIQETNIALTRYLESATWNQLGWPH